MDFRDLKEFLKDTSVYIIIIIAVLFTVNYVVTIQQNVGPSMNPTLENGDAFLLNRLSYKLSKPKRGDIIAFNYSDSKYLVKRVIGLPGETIEYKDNKLYINGQAFQENYLGNDIITYDFNMDSIIGSVDGIIPDNMYLVLGDNRPNSMDSREIGLITKDSIVGKTTIRIWPLSKLGFVK